VVGIIDGREGVCQRRKGGRTPTLVLCSRNARPEKGLVRRPHLDQHECPSKRGNTSKLGGSIDIVRCAQSRAASATPLKGEGGFDTGWNEGGLLSSCARGTRTIGMCSFNARSGRPNKPPSCEKSKRAWRDQRGWSLMIFCARATRGRGLPLAWANGTSRRASGWAGEKVARSGRSISPHP
jgi:hypothetical protein